jgi:hypothetical protein
MLLNMRRALTLTLAVALFGILAAVVVAQVGQDPAAPAGTTTEGTTTGDTTTEDRTTTTETTDDRGGDRGRGRDDNRVRVEDDNPGDISGPCDEAEHANDPRCAGVNVPQQPAPAQPQAPAQGVDISGPCDEAEHANDPRCTGVGGGRIDDHGGGSNSGPGSGDFDDDHSGSGHSGGDDFDDDSSGPGSGGDDFDDDSSGHGGGGNSGHGGGND